MASLGASNGSTEAIGFLRSIENPQPTRNEPAQDLFEEGGRLCNSGHQAEAARHFLKAAEAGNSLAQLQIGWHYENGVGVSQSFAQAANWYRKAAGNGNTAGMKNLGQLYELGQGVPENWVEAAKWYRTSAERGDPNGESALARAYEFGVGVHQSRQQAIEWDQRAAAQGNAQSAYYARWLRSKSNSIGFRNQEERNMFPGMPDQLIGEPVGVLFQSSAERVAIFRGIRGQYDLEEQLNAQRRQYCSEGHCALSKSEWERKYGKN